MPTYDYYCTQCCYAEEILQKITDSPLKSCPQCKEESLVRGPGGGVGLTFGPGFYNSGYSSPGMTSGVKSSTEKNGSCQHKGCGCAPPKNPQPPS